ncbi:MAG: phosphatidylserine/phosphatidylglycerophosphate/cardiolipin synthase family protein [Oligoflexia bacterium]|nr:phosphatidylserine/phosphatidylglycerophosphate/cardiolipin synthase family protein [Oligoflexia bacterium]
MEAKYFQNFKAISLFLLWILTSIIVVNTTIASDDEDEYQDEDSNNSYYNRYNGNYGGGRSIYKFVKGKCKQFSKRNVLISDNLNPLICIKAKREVFVWKEKSDGTIGCFHYLLTNKNFRGKKLVINKRTKVTPAKYNDCVVNKALNNDIVNHEDHLKSLYNDYTESILQRGEDDCVTNSKLDKFHNLYYNTTAPILKNISVPDWSIEELSGPKKKPIYLYNFMSKFKDWMTGEKEVSAKDLALRFASTDNNDFDVYSDHENFWPEVVKSVENAKSTINIQVFGLQADPWGWEFGKLLAKKAREGVKVKILADRLGARMSIFTKYKSAPLMNYLKKNGVEIVLSSDKINPASLHFDHRKCFIIDGKIAYNTGYTIEDHMRKKHFDVGVKAKGDIVKQMQASFLLNSVYFGNGDATITKKEFPKMMETYFPQYSVEDRYSKDSFMRGGEGKASAKLNMNIPRFQHPVTESYYNRIWNAKKSVWVINPYFSDKRIIEALKHATEKGIKVNIITPSNPENLLYKLNTKYHYEDLRKMGAKTLLYDGPKNIGWLHAKGIVIDEEVPNHCFASFGSTNMDAFALYHNYEQNIETSDCQTVKKIKKKVFDYAKNYSHMYEPPTNLLGKIKQNVLGVLSEIGKKAINPRPYRYNFTEEEDLQNSDLLSDD